MRLFLDQMFQVDLAAHLRVEHHDVVRAGEVKLARADDEEILAHAIREKRVLVTLDGHFGDWAVLPLTSHEGIIRLRIHPTTTTKALQVLRPLLAGRNQTQFRNQLVIASLRRTRWIRTAE